MLSPGIEALYKRRSEEGYNIFDPAYTKWLQQHLETISRSLNTPMTSPSNPPQLSKSTFKPETTGQQSTPLSDE